ncbi:MAG: threonine--tRNA ligase [Bacillota bacterium]
MSESIVVTFPDKSKKQYPKGVTPGEVAKCIGTGLTKAALAAEVNGEPVDLGTAICGDASVRILTFEEPEGKRVLWHSASHVLAEAVKTLFPAARLAIGPAIDDGFYYDFDVPSPFTPEDVDRIEQEMARIVREDAPFCRREVSGEEAKVLFQEEPYKLELLQDLDGPPSVYTSGAFTDLCAGPHVPSTGRIKAFKLLSVAGAYWRGDEKRPMLQRIYGTAYPNKADLEAHLERMEEARRRDHRRLGRDLDIFSIQEEAGPGLVFWHPKGGTVRQLVEDFWRAEHRRRGYDIVFSPHIARVGLWKISGHWDWYRESMYSPMDVDGVEYLIKPMNCPFHILMFNSSTRSYRDLPLRWAELGTVYRYERSGVLHGALRVRGFTQDDAHIFCRPDQLESEIIGVIDLALYMIRVFGYTDYEIMLSVRDPENKAKYIGNDQVWAMAEQALLDALKASSLPYVVGEGEAKFYGPAVDITLKDALGRGWQGPTIQVDFNLAERFDITYMGEDNRPHRPVMIHRTVLGSMERFVGGLLEHYAGAFPLWLAPVQAKVIPITERNHTYAGELVDLLRAMDIRVEADLRNEKVGYKIRRAEMEKIPYMLVVGDREQDARAAALRRRGEGDLGSKPVEEIIENLVHESRPPRSR